MSEDEIFHWTKRESQHFEPNDAENGAKFNEINIPSKKCRPIPENDVIEQKTLQQLDNIERICTAEKSFAWRDCADKVSTLAKIKGHESAQNEGSPQVPIL